MVPICCPQLPIRWPQLFTRWIRQVHNVSNSTHGGTTQGSIYDQIVAAATANMTVLNSLKLLYWLPNDCWSLRADSRLQSNAVSHWLGASLESALSLPDGADQDVAPIFQADHAYLPDFSHHRDHGLEISTVWPWLKPMSNNTIVVWFISVTPEDLLIKALFPGWQALSSAANGIHRSVLHGINV